MGHTAIQLWRVLPVLQRDPFGTASSLSERDCSRVHNQSVPSLAQLLQVASQGGRLVLFDLHKPPPGHPYRRSYMNVTLQVVHAHISSSQVSVKNTIREGGEKKKGTILWRLPLSPCATWVCVGAVAGV